MRYSTPILFFFSLALTSVLSVDLSRAAPPKTKKEIWVYTSIYKDFAEPIGKAFENKHPGITVKIFQAGSEKIQAKVEAELIAKKPQADILLTSDPFWSSELVKRGLAFARPGHEAVETNYYSLMVLVRHPSLSEEDAPKSFKDLTQPKYDNLIQSGSPLESGTTFSTVAYLSKKYGWDYFEGLKKNHLVAAGGNSTVIQKVESGEKKIGIVLLENVLAAKKRESLLEVIYPSDGSIPIPSVQVIMNTSLKKEEAGLFSEFILSQEGQKLLREGFMYSVNKSIPAPDGAKPLSEATKNSMSWNAAWIQNTASQAKEIKKKFAILILE